MRVPSLGAVLSISVDLESNVGSAGDCLSEQIREVARELLALFASAGQAVTWAAADPANSAAIDLVRRSDNPHEVALWASANWFRGDDRGSRFTTELVRRTAAARRACIRLTTLAVETDSRIEPTKLEHTELLVKQGFTAIRAARVAPAVRLRRGAGDSRNSPTALRHGLWQITPFARLAGGGAVEQWFAKVQIRGAIERSVRGGLPLHLTIDAPALASRQEGDRLRTVRAILRHVTRRSEAGELSVLTSADVVARASARREQPAATSILRAA
jgi:hypothetical protein